MTAKICSWDIVKGLLGEVGTGHIISSLEPQECTSISVSYISNFCLFLWLSVAVFLLSRMRQVKVIFMLKRAGFCLRGPERHNCRSAFYSQWAPGLANESRKPGSMGSKGSKWNRLRFRSFPPSIQSLNSGDRKCAVYKCLGARHIITRPR